MEILTLIQYSFVFIALPLGLYFILKTLGYIGSKTLAIAETEDRQTRKVKATREHVLICGPSGSGKTALINFLATNEWRETVSSLDSTKAQFNISAKVPVSSTDNGTVSKTLNLKYIDVPGHTHFLEETLDAAETSSTIILLVDSKDNASITSAVEVLYELLNNCRVVFEDKLPILIVCNKQDLPSAKKATTVEIDLEKEMDELKRVKVATEDPDKEYQGYVEGLKGRFEFKNIADFVQICEASIKTGQVQDITRFIVKTHLN
mmetsp:Transcript_24690/g.21922  ORF Transcript_24690/g.21922 Transcript_24690/m.21922 type:complete len:263 (-) Transcript_24690:25-813(-)